MSAKNRGDAEAVRLTYAKLRNKVKAMIRQAKRGFEKRIARNAETNPKAFWAHIRRRLKTKSGVAPLLENDNNKDSTMFGDEEKANILQNQFSSVSIQEPDGEIPTLDRRTDTAIQNIHSSKEMVRREINSF